MAPPTNPNWLRVAETLRRELQAAKYGTKSAILQRYATETGFHPASLRRDVMAVDFIIQVEKREPTFAATLRKLGSTSVLELSRLYETNPVGAIEAALAAASGRETRRQLSARRPKYESELRTGIRREAIRAFDSVATWHRLDGFGRPASLVGSIEGDLDTGVYFSTRGHRTSVCFAYCRLKGTKGTLKQFLPYLGLCQLHDDVLLAVDIREVPAEWKQALSDAQLGARLILFVCDRGDWFPVGAR